MSQYSQWTGFVRKFFLPKSWMTAGANDLINCGAAQVRLSTKTTQQRLSSSQDGWNDSSKNDAN